MLYYYGKDNGLNIKKDVEYAKQLFNKVANAGNREAIAELKKLGMM